MSYKNTSIKDAITKVDSNELLLPAIQRNFVWGSQRIENYFDSIMRGYPIGNFIWWKLDRTHTKNYPFYEFLKNYHERDKKQNDNAKTTIFKNRWGILDGQQRLSGIYIGICGSLTYKKKGKGHWSKDANFETLTLHFNIFARKKNDDDEHSKKYQFKFITESNAKSISDDQFWVKVSEIYEADTAKKIEDLVKSFEIQITELGKKTFVDRFNDKKGHLITSIKLFQKQITNNSLLSYFEVIETDLNEVLNIFIRVNSGGIILTKSQLMLATLGGTWPPARDKVEELVNQLARLKMYIDNDFVMRSALMICDLPVLFKAGSFTAKNVKQVVDSWGLIKDSLVRTAEALGEMGLLQDKFQILSKNAIIPIAYYISKNGDIKKPALRELKKYFVVSQVRGIFGSQGDGVLNKIRETLRFKNESAYVLKNKFFTYNQLLDIKFSGTKSFKIDEDLVNELIETEKGSEAYFLLSLLYPNIDYGKINLEMDHIHPFKFFNEIFLKSIGISNDDIGDWLWKGDSIVNLQLLTDKDNNYKRAKPLEEYLKNMETAEKGFTKGFVNDNFLPKTGYSFQNFNKFYDMRRKEIGKRLSQIFE